MRGYHTSRDQDYTSRQPLDAVKVANLMADRMAHKEGNDDEMRGRVERLERLMPWLLVTAVAAFIFSGTTFAALVVVMVGR